MKYLYLLWRNLLRKKIRTSLTLLSIFVAFVLFGLLVAVRDALTLGVDISGVDRMISMHKVSLIQPLPLSYKNRIEADEGVELVGHANWFGGVYQDPKNFFQQFAISPEYLEIYPEIDLKDEEREAFLRNRRGAIVGRTTANRFGWKVGDRIPLQGTIFRFQGGGAWEFELEGIYDAAKGYDNQTMFFHYKYLEEGGGIDGFIGWYVLRIADPDRGAEIAQRVDAMFANSPAETKTATEKAFVQGFANQVGDIGKIATGVLTVVFFTLLLVTGTTMAQSVRERTSELAVLKTLGFTDRQVMGMVLGESLLLTLLGGGFGLFLIAFVTNNFNLGGAMFQGGLVLTQQGILIGVALLLGMGLTAGALPAMQALRLSIVDALRRN